jgi:hypothetical protein
MRLPVGIVLLTLLGLGACASVLNGASQNLVVKTKSGMRDVAGASCTLSNNKGTWYVTSPGAVTVHRGADNLNVRCEYPGYIANAGSAPPTTGDLVFGNLIVGGVVGAAIDVGDGSAYDYPSPIIVNLQPATGSLVERSSSLTERADGNPYLRR